MHTIGDLPRNIQFLFGTDKQYLRSQRINAAIGKDSIAFRGPTLGATVYRAGTQGNYRPVFVDALALEKRARFVLANIGNLERGIGLYVEKCLLPGEQP